MPSLLARLNAVCAQKGLPLPVPTQATKSASPRISTPPAPRTWTPLAIELHTGTTQCRCGATHPTTPMLYLRETGPHNANRLRAISNPHNHPELPRRLVTEEPAQTQTCPACFSTEPTTQLRFMWPEELAVFITAISKTSTEFHQERVEQIKRMRAAKALHHTIPPSELSAIRKAAGPCLEPFAVGFGKNDGMSAIYYCAQDAAPSLLDADTTQQAVALARVNAIDIL